MNDGPLTSSSDAPLHTAGTPKIRNSLNSNRVSFHSSHHVLLSFLIAIHIGSSYSMVFTCRLFLVQLAALSQCLERTCSR
ncbi:hypothetical protein BJX62DRAFT_111325 [Aspergillus germanicus]